MAGTSIEAVTSANLTMSFATQYVTESLNKKLKAMPRGVVRGFRVMPGTANDEVDLIVDEIQGDSVMNAVGILNNKLYALTYRTDTTVTLDLSGLTDTGGVRYYIAFVPNYTISNPTDGEWRAYTEAQFEAGNIDADGGVFLFAIFLPDTDEIPKIHNIMLAGQSTTTFRAFMREDQQDFVQDRGQANRKLVVNWVPSPWDADDIGPTAVWDDADFIIGRGSVSITGTGSFSAPDRISETFIQLWTDPTDAERPKVTVQYWYKADATYNGTIGLDIIFYDEEGLVVTYANSENGAGRAPTYRVPPSGSSSGWKLIRYECHVPNPADHSSVRTVAARITQVGSITASGIKLGGLQVWVENEPSPQAGYHSYSGEICPVLAVSRMYFFDEPFCIDSSKRYWKLRVTNTNLYFELRPISGVTDTRSVYWGQVYAGPRQHRLYGDSTDNSYLLASGMHIETNRYVKTDDLRSVGFGAGSEIEARDANGANNCGLRAERLLATGATPLGATVPDLYTLYGGNMCHAWAVVTTDGASGIVLTRGYGVASVQFNGIDPQITLHRALTTANYYAKCESKGSANEVGKVVSTTTTQVRGRVIDAAAGTTVDLTANARTVLFVVIGDQP